MLGRVISSSPSIVAKPEVFTSAFMEGHPDVRLQLVLDN